MRLCNTNCFGYILLGEAMALTFKDIKNGYITISKTINNHGNRELGTPKTKSSNRKIWIDKVLERDLLNLKKYILKNILLIIIFLFLVVKNLFHLLQ